MFDSSIFNKNKLTRNNMKRILRKFPNYRWSYKNSMKEEELDMKILPFMGLSCELCKKYVASIIRDHYDSKIYYERYTQFQVICYDCYDKKLQFKVPDNIEDRDVHTFPKMPTEPFNLQSQKDFDIFFPEMMQQIQATSFYNIQSDKNKHIKTIDKGWRDVFTVTKDQIEELKNSGIKFRYFSDFVLEQNQL